MRAVACLALALAAAAPSFAARAKDKAASSLTPEQTRQVGRLIYLAETGGKPENLTFWNRGEDFPSLGIGHFIWYTARRWPYEESFPKVVAYLESRGVAMPPWSKGVCPWDNKSAFDSELNGPRLSALRRILLATFAEQTEFIMRRRAEALPAMLALLPTADRDELERRFVAVNASPVGAYAMIDYVNFKGEGVKPSERYNGQGWGLLQVLQDLELEPGKPANAAFAQACARVLERRVQNAPPGRQQDVERRFLTNWTERCSHYGLPTLERVLACKEAGRDCPAVPDRR